MIKFIGFVHKRLARSGRRHYKEPSHDRVATFIEEDYLDPAPVAVVISEKIFKKESTGNGVVRISPPFQHA